MSCGRGMVPAVRVVRRLKNWLWYLLRLTVGLFCIFLHAVRWRDNRIIQNVRVGLWGPQLRGRTEGAPPLLVPIWSRMLIHTIKSINHYQSFAVTRCQIFSAKMRQTEFRLGLRRRPRYRSLQSSPYLLAGGPANGLSCCVCVPSLKFVGLPFRKKFHIYCVSINGPCDLDLRPLRSWWRLSLMPVFVLRLCIKL